jgi:predicted nucleic-acid-binding Zn-ribbon protein
MKDGVCPKCSAPEVYRHLPKAINPSESITLTDSFINKGAMPEKFLCLSCGYLEFYLPLNDTVLAAVKEHWTKV